MARTRPWCEVREVDEAWTSKTCSRGCGKENMKLGGNEVFTCIDHTCNFIICDRDVNGGKNIALKNACEIDSAAAERAETARCGGPARRRRQPRR
jgi:transposase